MLTPTKIEYGEFNWQVYRGCLHKPMGVCPVTNCWSEAVSKRQGWDFHKPELLAKNLLDPLRKKKPSRILVNFSGDLFGMWVEPELQSGDVLRWGWKYDSTLPQSHECVMVNSTLSRRIERIVKGCPQHTFLFLTKNPSGIWPIEWPDNAWMGASACDHNMCQGATGFLRRVHARNKWLSLEPLLKWQTQNPKWLVEDWQAAGISWLVIGAEDHPLKLPKIEWVREIVEAADKAGIPVWLKNNLKPLFDNPNEYSPNIIQTWWGEGNCFGIKLHQELPG